METSRPLPRGAKGTRPHWAAIPLLAVLAACSGSEDPAGPDGDTLLVSEPGILSVDSTDPVTIGGPVAGPFAPAVTVLELANVGGLELDWIAECSDTWITLSSTEGSLLGGETFDLSITVNQSLAATYPESERVARVTLAQADDEESEIIIGFTLDVGESWSVEDQSIFYTSGPVGGPFSPSSRTYTVTNNFNTMLSWGVLSSAAWVTTNTNGGVLVPGDSAQVVASINQGSAAGLASGVNDSALTFSADLDPDSIVRTVRLTANAPDGDLEAAISMPGNTMRIAPFSTMFSGLDSIEDGEEIVRWLWDFGDDNSSDPRTDEGMLVGHRFDTPDTYTVTLTVIDASGASDAVTTEVVVVPFTGTTYYVSESGGDNSNNGLSTGAPFKTLEYAIDNMGGSQGAPNRLLLLRGDTWTQDSSLSTTGPSILGAYGSGARPKIQFPGEDDHLSLGHNQEWGLSRIVSDLHLTNPSGPRISKKLVTSVGYGNVMRDMLLDGGGIIASHTAGVPPEEHIMSLIMEDVTANNAERFGFYAQYHSWISARRCSFTGNGTGNILDHQMYLNIVQKNLWEDCYFDGGAGDCNFGMKQNSVVDGLFRRCEITNTRNGISCGTNFSDFTDPSNTNVINEDHEIHHIGSDNQGAAFRLTRIQSVTIRNCVMYEINVSPDYAIATIAFDNDDPGATVRVLNNTFYSNEVPDIDISSGLVYNLIEIKNNVFYRTGSPGSDATFYEISETEMLPFIESDYNAFWWSGESAADSTFAVGGSSPSHSFNTWKTTFSQDEHSSWIDPQFANAGSGDFSLNAGSPAIDAGVELARSHDDIEGSPRPTGAGHDMGAYER